MKTIKTWLTTIAMLLCCTPANAYDFQVDGIFYNIIDASNLTVEVTYGETLYEGTLEIPATVIYRDKEFLVTAIGREACHNCFFLDAVTIPHGVNSIGSSAFTHCNFSSIIIPNGVKTLEYGTFSYCDNLSFISLPEGLTTIGRHAFYECSHLTSISIPQSVSTIEWQAFEGCIGLTSINIPENVTTISRMLFSRCENLTSIIIHKNVEIIEQDAFQGCNNLEEIICEAINPPSLQYTVFPNTVNLWGTLKVPAESLEAYKVADGWKDFGSIVAIVESPTIVASGTCGDNLTWELTDAGELNIEGTGAMFGFFLEGSVTAAPWGNFAADIVTVSFGDGVTTIGENAFYGCSSLASITISENSQLISIGTCAFYNCSSLTSIFVPETVAHIYSGAFYNCASLSEISIPSSITILKLMTFFKCNNLKSFTCHATTPPTLEKDTYNNYYTVFHEVSLSDITLYVPEGSIDVYKNTETWKDFGEIKPIKKDAVINDAAQLFEKNEDEECASITYTRTFNNTNWQALYVPFEIPVTEEFLADFEVADLNDIRQYDRDDDGVKDETVVEAFKVKSGATLAANYPFLIRAKEVGEKTITVTDATLYATEEVSIDCSSVHEKFTFTGTYSRKASDELAGCYALCDGVWQPLAADATLGAFRVYLRIESRDSNIAPARAIRMHVVGEDGATDIDELESNANNQQPAVVYDLQGRRITNVDNLKGVYIVNGKKVVK